MKAIKVALKVGFWIGYGLSLILFVLLGLANGVTLADLTRIIFGPVMNGAILSVAAATLVAPFAVVAYIIRQLTAEVRDGGNDDAQV